MHNPASVRLPSARTAATRVVVPASVLHATVSGLRDRSAGWRESACVWIGTRSNEVKKVVFHHELADDHATALSLELPESAKYSLYRQLGRDEHRILALLHTHPESWVDLSWIDQQNQISSRLGFLSIVLPFYGEANWDLTTVGFHVKCERGWRRLSVPEIKAAVIIDAHR
jgi:proteasome lid subunit RPN8/RPN11